MPESAPFVRIEGDGCRLLVRPAFEPCARALGLDDAATLDALIADMPEDRTRRAGRAACRTLETEIGAVHVKRALKGGVLAPLFGGRIPLFVRAAHEIEVALVLDERGAPVPSPLFAAGFHDARGWRVLIGTRLVEGACDGGTAIEGALTGTDPRSEITSLATRIGTAVRCFHDVGGWHRDLNITNVLVSRPRNEMDDAGNGDETRVMVIDLQGARASAPPPLRRRKRELLRLRRSIERRTQLLPFIAGGWKSLVEAYCEPNASFTSVLRRSL